MEELNTEVTVTIIENGPIFIDGVIDIVQGDKMVEHKQCYLCRCGGSNKKPYCDGTHKKIDFKG